MDATARPCSAANISVTGRAIPDSVRPKLRVPRIQIQEKGADRRHTENSIEASILRLLRSGFIACSKWLFVERSIRKFEPSKQRLPTSESVKRSHPHVAEKQSLTNNFRSNYQSPAPTRNGWNSVWKILASSVESGRSVFEVCQSKCFLEFTPSVVHPSEVEPQICNFL